MGSKPVATGSEPMPVEMSEVSALQHRSTKELPNVHREHLPASRYGANPSTRPSGDLSPPLKASRLGGNQGHHPAIAAGTSLTISWSIWLCGLFSALAIAQMLLAIKLRRSRGALGGGGGGGGGGERAVVAGGDGAGNWRAGWLLALVPAAVARCCALLLLILDLEERSGGGMPGQVAFLYSVSTFFDSVSSWLFYTAKVTCVFAARGGGISSRMRAIAACSIGYGIVLFLTVGLSLHYGDACVETASERDCSLSASWQATFHVAMAAASLASFVVLVRVSIRPSRQLQLAPHHSDAPLRSRVAGAAGVCICSVAWWALFNAWGCMVAFGSLPTSPAETERYAAVNLIVSELVPALAITAVIAVSTGTPSSRGLGGGLRKASSDAGDVVDQAELKPMLGIL